MTEPETPRELTELEYIERARARAEVRASPRRDSSALALRGQGAPVVEVVSRRTHSARGVSPLAASSAAASLTVYLTITATARGSAEIGRPAPGRVPPLLTGGVGNDAGARTTGARLGAARGEKTRPFGAALGPAKRIASAKGEDAEGGLLKIARTVGFGAEGGDLGVGGGHGNLRVVCGLGGFPPRPSTIARQGFRATVNRHKDATIYRHPRSALRPARVRRLRLDHDATGAASTRPGEHHKQDERRGEQDERRAMERHRAIVAYA